MIAEIDIEIFGLEGQILGDRIFKAETRRPAHPGVRNAIAADAGLIRVILDMAEGAAAGHIGQKIAERRHHGIADAPAGRSQPLKNRALRERDASRIGLRELAADVGPVEITLDAEDEIGGRDLIIEADRAAGDEAARGQFLR